MAATRAEHFVVTLTGAAQRLATEIPLIDADVPVRVFSLQPGAANANPVYLGASGVSATDYGVRMPAAAAGVPPAPFLLGEFDDGTLNLGDLYVIGTADEKLHALVIRAVWGP